MDKYDPHNHMASAAEQWDGWSSDDDGAEKKKVNDNEGTVYDLALGWPKDEEAPRKVIKTACCDALDDAGSNPLNYGENKGDNSVRDAVSEFLTRQYGEIIKGENIMLTGGSSQGLDLCCSTFGGQAVAVEETTYYLALEIFKTHNLDVIPMKTDCHGVIPGEIASLPPTVNFVYIIPTHQNPTGVTMPDTRRRELIAACRVKGVRLVADEVYHCLSWGGERVTPMACFGEDCVVSISSFTKILSPGLRVGWVQGGVSVIDELEKRSGLIQSGGGLSQFTAHVVARSIRSKELDNYLKILTATYQRRSASLTAALTQHLSPLGVSFSHPTGGYFVWATLPHTVTTAQFLAVLPSNVKVADGTPFSPGSPCTSHSFRVCFVRYDERELHEAVELLADALKTLLI